MPLSQGVGRYSPNELEASGGRTVTMVTHHSLPDVKRPLAVEDMDDTSIGLVEALYAAIAEPARLTATLDRMRDAVGADFVVQRIGLTADEFVVASSPTDPTVLSDYATHFAAIDPWLGNLPKLTSSGVTGCAALMPYDAFVRTPFYNEFLSEQKLHWGLAALVDPNPSTASYLTFMRARSAGDFSDEQTRLLAGLLPHLSVAMKIHRRLYGLDLSCQRFEHALDGLRTGVLLLGVAGEILHANRVASSLLGASRCLVARNQRLHAVDRREDEKLQARLALSCADTPGVTGRDTAAPFIIGANSPADALDLFIAPFRANERWHGAGEPRAVVFMQGLTDIPMQFDLLLRLRYGLTPAEARCAIELIDGDSIKVVAARCSQSVTTVRTHVRALHAKLGVRSHGALIAKLNRDLAVGRLVDTVTQEPPL